MKKTLKAATAATLLAGAFALAIPTAANASYNDNDNDANNDGATVSSAVVTPGEAVDFNIEDGVFGSNVPVTITLQGESASGASLAFVKFANETANLGTVNSAADGSATAEVVMPSNATGSYTLTASGVDANGVRRQVSETVTAATAAAPGGTIPVTGGDTSALLGLWVGGGALLLAGGGLAVAGTVRRHRSQATA